MKILSKLLLFSVLLLLVKTGNTQSFCAGISTDAYPANPQTGPTDRYGVRVTLDQTYDQNITITGTISSNTRQKNFSLTVTAGNLTAETASNFFAVSPGISVSITISGSSPLTLTKQGLTYGTGCSASDPSDRLDTLAQIHTDYQEHLFTYLTTNNVDLSDTFNLKSIINTQSASFFASKGMTVPSMNVNIAEGLTGSDTLFYNPLNYSVAGNSILNSLKSLLLNYDPVNEAAFLFSLDSLKGQALSLSDPNEVYSVGVPVFIAISSFNYWKTNGQYWIDLFEEQDSIRNSGTSLLINDYPGSFALSKGPNPEDEPNIGFNSTNPGERWSTNNVFRCKVDVRQTVVADAAGGVRGFIFGAFGTPAGSLIAAGVLAPTSSAISLIGQGLTCLFGW